MVPQHRGAGHRAHDRGRVVTSFLDLDRGEITRLADTLYDGWRLAEDTRGWDAFSMELWGLWQWAQGLTWGAPA
jgi:hypothetical protein